MITTQHTLNNLVLMTAAFSLRVGTSALAAEMQIAH